MSVRVRPVTTLSRKAERHGSRSGGGERERLPNPNPPSPSLPPSTGKRGTQLQPPQSSLPSVAQQTVSPRVAVTRSVELANSPLQARHQNMEKLTSLVRVQDHQQPTALL